MSILVNITCRCIANQKVSFQGINEKIEGSNWLQILGKRKVGNGNWLGKIKIGKGTAATYPRRQPDGDNDTIILLIMLKYWNF